MESISRISSVLETGMHCKALSNMAHSLTTHAARELTIEAAQGASSTRSLATRSIIRDLSFVQIKKLLDSRNDREILEGLRKVISVRLHATSWPQHRF